MSAQALDSPQPELHGPAYEWSQWSTTVRVVTADPAALRSAKRLVDDVLADVDPTASARSPVRPGRWRGIELDEERRRVRLPAGVRLDLTRIARAWAADRCAQVVAEQLAVGCLVSLGGDIATAGPLGAASDGGWEILVRDREDGPASVIALPTGLCIATASTAPPRRGQDGHDLRHGLHPLIGPGVSSDWRTATVVATDCVSASTWATTCILEGLGVSERLDAEGLPARLVGRDGRVRHLGGWPPDAETDAMTSMS